MPKSGETTWRVEYVGMPKHPWRIVDAETGDYIRKPDGSAYAFDTADQAIKKMPSIAREQRLVSVPKAQMDISPVKEEPEEKPMRVSENLAQKYFELQRLDEQEAISFDAFWKAMNAEMKAVLPEDEDDASLVEAAKTVAENLDKDPKHYEKKGERLEEAEPFHQKMMPGQTPYTPREKETLRRMTAAAIEGDPGEAGEPPICPNCGQYRRKTSYGLDCTNQCAKRGFVTEAASGEPVNVATVYLEFLGEIPEFFAGESGSHASQVENLGALDIDYLPQSKVFYLSLDPPNGTTAAVESAEEALRLAKRYWGREAKIGKNSYVDVDTRELEEYYPGVEFPHKGDMHKSIRSFRRAMGEEV